MKYKQKSRLWNWEVSRENKMAVFQNTLSNISNLTMCVQKDGLDSGVTLVELDFKPQGTHWNQFTKPETSKNPFCKNFLLMLHFKTLVTSCGHHSGKIIMPSYVKENSSHYHCSLAYTLYFQEILGLPMIRRRKTWFCMGFMLKNTPKWPFFHDANCWATWYITVFCENNRKLEAKLDIFSLYTP